MIIAKIQGYCIISHTVKNMFCICIFWKLKIVKVADVNLTCQYHNSRRMKDAITLKYRTCKGTKVCLCKHSYFWATKFQLLEANSASILDISCVTERHTAGGVVESYNFSLQFLPIPNHPVISLQTMHYRRGMYKYILVFV